MDLYVYENYKGNRNSDNSTNQLIGMALKQYFEEHGLGTPAGYDFSTICRTQKGKPYIENSSIHFSVSHSDNLWVCLIGNDENGVDIQRNHHNNYEAIARRFFLPGEQLAVLRGGLEAFIGIWCRKEAFVKYFGMTIGETMEWLDVAKDGTPVDHIIHKEHIIYFSQLEVNHDYQCVAATGTKELIWIKKIRTE